MRHHLATAATAATLISAPYAWAQETITVPIQDPAAQQQGAEVQQPAAGQQLAATGQGAYAEACMADLRALNDELAGAGYGVAGPAGWGAGWGGTAAPGVVAPGAAAPGVAGTTGVAGAGVGGAGMAGGWYAGLGPRDELRVLYAAAEVFARNGDQEACQTVVNETRDLYQTRMARLQEAGVDPNEVRTWREGQLATAQPVSETQVLRRADEIIGADVRNVADEDLGDIEDVILDPQTGQISHVLVSKGGFLGLGEDWYAVRWNDLRVVPGMDTFVLNVPEEVVENMPNIDRDALRDPGRFTQLQQDIDAYWDQHIRS